MIRRVCIVYVCDYDDFYDAGVDAMVYVMVRWFKGAMLRMMVFVVCEAVAMCGRAIIM